MVGRYEVDGLEALKGSTGKRSSTLKSVCVGIGSKTELIPKLEPQQATCPHIHATRFEAGPSEKSLPHQPASRNWARKIEGRKDGKPECTGEEEI